MRYIQFLLAALLIAVTVRQSEGNASENFCQRKRKVAVEDLIQFRPGDIIIGAAMQLTFENENGTCVQESYGIQLVETMNMIIDQVNSNDSILNGVKLGTIMIDTCSSDSHALQRVIMDILPLVLNDRGSVDCNKKGLLAGVVGASLSSVSMQLSRILQVFKIPQISYWSTSADFSDKKRFPYFFRSVASDIHQVEALVALLKYRNWKYISVIYDDDNYGVDGYSELRRVATKEKICIAYSRAIIRNAATDSMTDIVGELVEIEKKNARVVVLFTVTANAEKIISAAQKNRKAANSLVWVGVDGWTGALPRDHKNRNFLDALDGAIGFVPKLDTPPNLTEYLTNLTLQEHYGENSSRNPWFADYISKRNNCTLPKARVPGVRECDMQESLSRPTLRIYPTPIADAVSAFVHALDDYHQIVCQGESGLCESMKNMSGTTLLAENIFGYLQNVSFIGAGGSEFKFDENLDGPPAYEIFVFSKNKVANRSEHILDGWIKAGVYRNKKLQWTSSLPTKVNETTSICSEPCSPGEAQIPGATVCCWFCQQCGSNQYVHNRTSCQDCHEGSKPNKAVNGCEPLPVKLMEYSSGYFIFILTLGTIGLVWTIFVTIVFIKCRETPIVRASGKELCFFVLFGIFFTLLNCFTVTLYPSTISCAATRVILALGPSCMYVGLLMKTIRIVFIFQSKGIMTAKIKKYLQPAEFTLMTTGVAAIQIIILIIWFIFNAPSVVSRHSEEWTYKTCETLVEYEILYGLVFPFVIIIICTILATINRNVPTGFRETLLVGFAMYTTCVIWLTFLPIFSTNSTDVPRKLTTVSAALSFSAITVLCCLFFPRCYVILFQPHLNTTESVMSRQQTVETNAWNSSISPSPVALKVANKKSVSRRCYEVRANC